MRPGSSKNGSVRPRAVTAEEIINAADRVARRSGMDSLTVRHLCTELGVTAPAVYRHFASKDLIVSEVVDRIIARTELPGPEIGDWAERLRVCFVSVHDEVAPYAGLAARMGQEMPQTPAAVRNGQYLREVLDSAGIDEPTAIKIIFAIFVYSWGHLLAGGVTNPVTGEDNDNEQSREQFLWGLSHLLGSFRRDFGGVTGGLDAAKIRAAPKPGAKARKARSPRRQRLA
jgi:AcrR family transcriptional regulator